MWPIIFVLPVTWTLVATWRIVVDRLDRCICYLFFLITLSTLSSRCWDVYLLFLPMHGLGLCWCKFVFCRCKLSLALLSSSRVQHSWHLTLFYITAPVTGGHHCETCERSLLIYQYSIRQILLFRIPSPNRLAWMLPSNTPCDWVWI